MGSFLVGFDRCLFDAFVHSQVADGAGLLSFSNRSPFSPCILHCSAKLVMLAFL
jgi:hypothetical protein